MKTNKDSKRCVKCKDWLKSIPYRGFDIIIIAILILSVYVILVIGLDLDCLKAGLNSTPKKINNINSVLLNLSYSYAAGVFVYMLTVMRPYYKRRKKCAEFIYRHVIKYKEHAMISSLYSFYRYDFFKKNKTNMDFFESQDIYHKAFVISNCEKEDLKTLENRLMYTFNEKNTLIDFILNNEDLLPDEVLNYVMVFKEIECEEKLEVILYVINMQGSKDTESDYRKIYDILDVYISKLNDLEYEIGKYTSKQVANKAAK